ncbi:hypothetical protein ACNOYE_25290 [Nannocystaceae bacterium ST9]
MESLVRLIVLALPLLVLVLLASLGLIIHVVANEGRSRSSSWARGVGVFDLLATLPLAIAAWGAEARDVRGMFAFAALAFGFLGLMALRMVARYRE